MDTLREWVEQNAYIMGSIALAALFALTAKWTWLGGFTWHTGTLVCMSLASATYPKWAKMFRNTFGYFKRSYAARRTAVLLEEALVDFSRGIERRWEANFPHSTSINLKCVGIPATLLDRRSSTRQWLKGEEIRIFLTYKVPNPENSNGDPLQRAQELIRVQVLPLDSSTISERRTWWIWDGKSWSDYPSYPKAIAALQSLYDQLLVSNSSTRLQVIDGGRTARIGS